MNYVECCRILGLSGDRVYTQQELESAFRMMGMKYRGKPEYDKIKRAYVHVKEIRHREESVDDRSSILSEWSMSTPLRPLSVNTMALVPQKGGGQRVQSEEVRMTPMITHLSENLPIYPITLTPYQVYMGTMISLDIGLESQYIEIPMGIGVNEVVNCRLSGGGEVRVKLIKIEPCDSDVRRVNLDIIFTPLIQFKDLLSGKIRIIYKHVDMSTYDYGGRLYELYTLKDNNTYFEREIVGMGYRRKTADGGMVAGNLIIRPRISLPSTSDEFKELMFSLVRRHPSLMKMIGGGTTMDDDNVSMMTDGSR